MTKEKECGLQKVTDDFIEILTPDKFLAFRRSHKPYDHPRPPADGSYNPMTAFSGPTKPSPPSESQIALSNFKRGTKRDATAYPIFKNDLYYDTFQRSFLAIIKAQGLSNVSNPDFEPDDGDPYAQALLQEKNNLLFVLYW